VREVKEELRRRMHDPIPSQGQWLRQVLTGFFAYHAVPTNSDALTAFRYHTFARFVVSSLNGAGYEWS
jgi:RNA-directed DNA polymerase